MAGNIKTCEMGSGSLVHKLTYFCAFGSALLLIVNMD